MAELRLVPFAKDYWHVVNDDIDHAGIIGSIAFMSSEHGQLLVPWRAEFTGDIFTTSRSELTVGYCASQQEAIEYLERRLNECLEGAA